MDGATDHTAFTGPTADMIQTEALTKAYGGIVALNGVTLSCPVGSTNVLIGPSGCGKSTLLRMVAGLVWPTGGQVRFDGEVITAANVQQIRHRTGYVIQEGGLFPHLTARGNVTLAAQYLGWDRDRVDARLAEVARLARFPMERLTSKPGQLSGGQQQRVSIMRALMLDPDVLLLDEPLGALDPMIRADLQQELRELMGRLGKTVLLVTHDLAEAAWFADVIHLMRQGKIVQSGALGDFAERPANAFVEQFVRAQRHLHMGGGA